MVVLNVVNCPIQLRGDLTKWMLEIDTGVYVGKLNSRVRELIWKRVCENIKTGKASMVYSCNNEQGYGFYTHNTMWRPEDYDGITLIKEIYSLTEDEKALIGLKKRFSNASKYGYFKKNRSQMPGEYIILDVESSGLDYKNDRVIEIAMLLIQNGTIADRFQTLVKTPKRLPDTIVNLTGITNEMLDQDGLDEKEAFNLMLDFIGSKEIVGYNIGFDISFLEEMARRVDEELEFVKVKDVLNLVKRKVKGLENNKLKTVADYYGIDSSGMHRALKDCEVLYRVYEELNKT